jgi:MoaA/NifB/PqqE/SkfB family radical SAM enzyme
MYIRPIERLQIDYCSSCNAGCLFCSRQDFFGKLQPNFPKNTTLPLSIFKKAIADPALRNLKEVFFCGNYGDALASPKILEPLTWLAERHPNIRWNIHTNGSLGTREFWIQLANLSKLSRGIVKFSIDGLEDTNSIYRKNVSFEKVMENLETFIAFGGKAVWKYIEFSHNSHQIEAAKVLSERLGCARFELRKNYSPESEYLLFASSLHAPPQEDQLKNEFTALTTIPKNKSIQCKAKIENFIYLDFEGLIWPCCWIHDWKYSPTKAKQEWHRNFFTPHESEKFNSLELKSIEEILDHKFFRETLPKSHESFDGYKLHPTCNTTCAISNQPT